MTKQNQTIGLFSLTIIVISLVVGMGIFKTPATIAAKSGIVEIFFMAWIIAGIFTMFGALIYAEIGQRMPAMGGYYKIFSYCYSPVIAFAINILILVSNAAILAVIALIGSDYVSDFLFNQPSSKFFNVAVAIISVASFYFVNLFGLKTSTILQNILTILKIALIILLIASLLKGQSATVHGYNDEEILQYNGDNFFTLLLLGLVPAAFTYNGYQQVINFGSEVRSSKVISRSVIVGVFIATLLYLAINYAYVKVIGFEELKNANAIASLLSEVWFGKIGAKIFDFFMILSVLGYVNITLLSNPRVMFAMSKDKVLPQIFQQQNQQTKSLSWGLAIFTILTIIITFFGKEVDDVLSFSVFLECLGMIGSAATLFILRFKKQGDEFVDGILKKITPFLTILYVIFCVVIAIAVVLGNPLSALAAVVLLALAVLFYLLFLKKIKAK